MLIYLILFLPIGVIIHEYAHGWVAYKLGDSTAKHAGRLTLNPLAHIDFFGTILFPLLLILMRSSFLFAWAKPVPVDFNNLHNPKRDMVWVGLAGPASNMVLAILLSAVLRTHFFPSSSIGHLLLSGGIFINVLLAIFNLIPVPPLDGSRILMGLVPIEYARGYAKLEPYGFIILFAFLWLGIFQGLVLPIAFYLVGLLGVK